MAAGDAAALDQTLQEAAELRAGWLADKARGDWDTPEKAAPEMPKAGDSLKRFLVGGLFDRKR